MGRTARCIDLEPLSFLAGGDTSELGMRRRGGTLVVEEGGSSAVLVNTQTFAVSEPSTGATQPSPNEDGRSWWVLALTVAGIAAVLGLAAIRALPGMRARRRSA